MKIEELKDAWNETGAKLTHSDPLNYPTQDRLPRSRISAAIMWIKIPELAGVLVCFAGVVILGIYFYKLDTIVFQAAGLLGISLLIVIPLLSICSIYRLSLREDPAIPYAETLKDFATNTLTFYRLQKWAMLLGYLLLVVVIILLPKIFGGKDIIAYKNFLLYAPPVGFAVFFYFSGWVNKKYRKAIRSAEALLKDLDYV